MIDKLLTFLKRREQHSYTQLWEMVYGDGWYDKGLIREYWLMTEAANHWRREYEALRRKTMGDLVELTRDELRDDLFGDQ